jgi:hypothetical protein
MPALTGLLLAIAFFAAGCASLHLDHGTPTDPALQARLEQIDGKVRDKFGMATEHTAVAVLNLRDGRVAMIHPDRGESAGLL